MNLHVDLGQIIISTLIVAVGYFVKKEIATFGKRLDRHEQVLFDMNGVMTRAVGSVDILFRLLEIDRRQQLREKPNA